MSSRDLAFPVARTVRLRSIHLRRHRLLVPSRPRGRNRPERCPELARRTDVFRRTRAAPAENGLGTRPSLPRTPSIGRRSRFFTESRHAAINVFGQSPHGLDTLSPITAARSVTSFTELPRRADPSPSRRLPAAIAGDVRAPGEIGEDASRQSLQPCLLSKKRAPNEPFDPRAPGFHPTFRRTLGAPRDRTLVRFAKCPGCVGAVSPTAFAAGYLGLESRSGWCRRRELWLVPPSPRGPKPSRVDRAPMARSKSAPACSAETRTRRNRPLTLPVAPPVRSNESTDPDGVRSHEPFRPRAAERRVAPFSVDSFPQAAHHRCRFPEPKRLPPMKSFPAGTRPASCFRKFPASAWIAPRGGELPGRKFC